MDILKDYIEKQVYVEISGNIIHKGFLVDTGTDIIVLFNGQDFLYIPLIHIQNIREKDDDTIDVNHFEGSPIESFNESISFRKILNNARGMFAEIHIANNQAIHGYVISVMNNYVVFYSPVYKTVYVSLQHLKCIIPYNQQQTPYDLKKENLPVNPFNLPLSRTFEEQLKKIINQIVVLDLGIDQSKIGQLKTVDNNMAELITARQSKSYVNLRHIKTIHIP